MAQITKTSNLGVNMIKGFEGFKSSPYLCPAGIPTIGYGSTMYTTGKKVTLKDPSITEEYATSLLNDTLTTYEKAVDSYTTDNINQSQFDALVSFAYNLGTNSLRNSTLLKKININPKDPSIKAEFNKWVYADGKILPGLVTRRAAEAKLYFQ